MYYRFGRFFAAFAKIEGSACLWWLMTAYLLAWAAAANLELSPIETEPNRLIEPR